MLADADTPSVIRAWSDGDCAPGRKLWSRLADMGVLELGGCPVELVIAFEELGRAAVPGPYVESVAVLPALLPGFEPGVMATVAVPPHVPYALDAAVSDIVYVVDEGTIWTAAAERELQSVDRARRLAEVHPVSPVARIDGTPAFDLG